MSREYTTEEVRTMFLEYVWRSIDSIERGSSTTQTTRDKLKRLAFSMLSFIDGTSLDSPRFILAPCPHSDDKESLISSGASYFPENDGEAVVADISGELHDRFFDFDPSRSD